MRTFRTLGVLGGMGPAATVDFLAKLQATTPAREDADHVRVLMDLNPRTPDRHTHGVAAGETLAEMTRALVGMGAEIIAMPCNTAHAHAETIRAATDGRATFIDMIDETVQAARATGARRIGIMATPGGRALYQARLAEAGLEPVILSPEDEKRLMGLIFAIKAKQLDRPAMARLADILIAGGAEAIVAGCTEVPLALADGDVAVRVIDSSQALAEACVRACVS